MRVSAINQVFSVIFHEIHQRASTPVTWHAVIEGTSGVELSRLTAFAGSSFINVTTDHTNPINEGCTRRSPKKTIEETVGHGLHSAMSLGNILQHLIHPRDCLYSVKANF